VRCSSAAVYGAWENNPVPLTEEAVLRPNPGYLPAILDAECERVVAEWAHAKEGRVATRLRVAPVVGAGSTSVLAGAATGSPPIVVRAPHAPVQVVHVDDVASALLLSVERSLAGVYNVAPDGWLASEDADALHPHRHLPGIPSEAAERVLDVMWRSGLGDAPPAVVPYLSHPWVVANDRIKDAGWQPSHTNEEAILLASPLESPRTWPWIVGGVLAFLLGLAGSSWWLLRRRRARRAAQVVQVIVERPVP